jgi:hypothetical protein
VPCKHRGHTFVCFVVEFVFRIVFCTYPSAVAGDTAQDSKFDAEGVAVAIVEVEVAYFHVYVAVFTVLKCYIAQSQ